jgi:hypothetical protein
MTQKRDDRGAVWLDCKRQARCAIAGKRRGKHRQRGRSQERSRVHTYETKRLRAPAVGPKPARWTIDENRATALDACEELE